VLPFFLLFCKSLSFFIPPLLAFFPFYQALLSQLLLLLSVESIAFSIIGPSAKRGRHLVQLGFFCRCKRVRIRWLQRLCGRWGREHGQELFSQSGNLSLDLVFLEAFVF
jgi:hypothetical protein